MEKETPVTAEDFYHSQAEFNRWLRDLMPHEKSHLKYMLEEYASIRAEQARQEERGKIKSEMENLKFTAEDMAEFAEWFSRNWDLDFKENQALEVWLKERESK